MGNSKKQGTLCCRTPGRLRNWKHQEPLKACRVGKESYQVRLKARLVESLQALIRVEGGAFLKTGVLSEISHNEQAPPSCPTALLGNSRALADSLKRPQTEDWPFPLCGNGPPYLRIHQNIPGNKSHQSAF